jgi:hypothetical protein
MATLITPALVAAVRDAFRLDWGGVLGAGHWARVRWRGTRTLLSKLVGTPTGSTSVGLISGPTRLAWGLKPENGWSTGLPAPISQHLAYGQREARLAQAVVTSSRHRAHAQSPIQARLGSSP